MTNLIFETLPAKLGHPRPPATEHARIIAALKARRGEWARFRTYSTGAIAYQTAIRIREGKLRWAKGCEAHAQKVGTEYRVYLRWPVTQPEAAAA